MVLLEMGVHRGRLNCLRARAIVNSILTSKNVRKVPPKRRYCAQVRRCGGGEAFDEQGQAATIREKIRICERAYRIPRRPSRGFPSEDIIFDPNILTVANRWRSKQQLSGRLSHQTLRAWIKPPCRTPRSRAGRLELSFSFRGNTRFRGMQLRFLYHAMRRAMAHGHLNPGMPRGIDEMSPS